MGPNYIGDNPKAKREPFDMGDTRLDLLQWYLKLIVGSVEERKD